MICRILQGDVIERLAELPDENFHGCLTDPPYALGEKRNMPPLLNTGELCKS